MRAPPVLLLLHRATCEASSPKPPSVHLYSITSHPSSKAASVDSGESGVAFCAHLVALLCWSMTKDDHDKLLRYIELCRRIYERMRRENAWPWVDDSPDTDDVVESKDNPNDI